jgi:hypothetical protein
MFLFLILFQVINNQVILPPFLSEITELGV